MLSGRYRTCWLSRHWSGVPTGNWRMPGCSGMQGSLQHLVTGECPALYGALVRAVAIWASFLKENPNLFPIVKQYSLGPPEEFLSFLVDPTTLPPVIALSQLHGSIIIEQLCYMTRTWIFFMHKQRLKLLNLWKWDNFTALTKPFACRLRIWIFIYIKFGFIHPSTL